MNARRVELKRHLNALGAFPIWRGRFHCVIVCGRPLTFRTRRRLTPVQREALIEALASALVDDYRAQTKDSESQRTERTERTDDKTIT